MTASRRPLGQSDDLYVRVEPAPAVGTRGGKVVGHAPLQGQAHLATRVLSEGRYKVATWRVGVGFSRKGVSATCKVRVIKDSGLSIGVL